MEDWELAETPMQDADISEPPLRADFVAKVVEDFGEE